MNPILSNVLSCDVEFPDLPWGHKPMGRVPKVRGYRKRMNESQRKPDMMIASRSKFSHSVISFPPKSATVHLSSSSGSSFINRTAEKQKITQKSVQVETQYRESSAQTDPWEPPVKIIGRGDPEILTMEFNWGSGLPITPHAVEAIEKARMKAAWMKIIKPNRNDETSLNTFSNHLLALELDDWKNREEQIDKVQNMRLELLGGVIENFHETSNTCTEQKMARIVQRMEEELEEELSKVKRESERHLRRHETRGKLLNKHDVSKTSVTYAPLVRKRQEAQKWHKVVDEKVKTYQPQFIGVENISTAPKWLRKATVPKKPKYTDIPNEREINLCIRETKWKPDVLLSLQIEFRNIQKHLLKKDPLFLTRIPPKLELAQIPKLNQTLNIIKIQYQCAVTFQNIITDHTRQLIIDEGRDNGNEVIQDLVTKAKEEQRAEFIRENSGKLQDVIMGSSFDFLNKEQSELQDERDGHAICLVNERERFAIEVNGPQQEMSDKNEQIVNHEYIDVYSENIIIEGTRLISEAGNYIKTFSERINSEIIDSEGDEMTTESPHFLIPEATANTTKLQALQDKIGQEVDDLTYQQLEEYRESVDVVKSEEYDEDDTYSFVFRLLNEIL